LLDEVSNERRGSSASLPADRCASWGARLLLPGLALLELLHHCKEWVHWSSSGDGSSSSAAGRGPSGSSTGCGIARGRSSRRFLLR